MRKFGVGSTIGNVTYSTIFNPTYVVKNVTLDPKKGWKSLKNTTNEWVGLTFDNDTKIERVVIQTGEDSAYPTEVFIETSPDNKNFTRLPKPLTLTQAPNTKKIFEIAPITVRSVRLIVTKYVKWPALKFDVLFTDETCKEDTDSDETIDVDPQAEYDSRVVLTRKNQTDKDDYIRTFRIQPWEQLPVELLNLIKRFNETRYVNDKGSLPISKIGILTYSSLKAPENINYTLEQVGWQAKNNKTNEFAGVITPFPVNITEIHIRPTDDGSYPTDFDVEYRDDLINSTYKKLNSEPYKLTNFTNNGISVFKIAPTRVMDVRIIVRKYNRWPAMRFELVYTDPSYVAFLEAAKKIKDDLKGKVTEDPDTSVGKDGTPTSSGSAPGFENPTSPDGWKSKENKENVYVGLKYKTPIDVSGVKVSDGTQGDVKSFTIQYFESKNPTVAKEIRPEDGSLTTDPKGVRVFRFNRVIKVIEIRVVVKKFATWPAVRFESFKTKGQEPIQPVVDEKDDSLKGEPATSGAMPGYEDPSFTSNDGWKAAENKTGVYTGLKFKNPTEISGIRLADGASGDVKDFTIQYSDPQNPLAFKELTPADGTLTTDAKGVRVFRFSRVLRVLEIRIIIRKYTNWPGARTDYFKTQGQEVVTIVSGNSDEEPKLQGELVSTGTMVGYEDYSFNSNDGWRSLTNKTGVNAGLQFKTPVYISGVRLLGDATDVSFQYVDAASNNTVKNLTVSSDVVSVDSQGVRTYRLIPSLRVLKFVIIVNKYDKWPAFKFELFGSNDLWTISDIATFSSSGSQTGFEDHKLSSKSGWKSSTNATEVWAANTWSTPISISALKIGNASGDVSNFTVRFKRNSSSSLEDLKLASYTTDSKGFRVYRFTTIQAVEVRIIVKKYTSWPGFKFELFDYLKSYIFTYGYGASTTFANVTIAKVNNYYPEFTVQYKDDKSTDPNAYVCYNGCKPVKSMLAIPNVPFGLVFKPQFSTKEVKITARAVSKPDKPTLGKA